VTLLYPQKLALTSPTGGGRSVGIVRSRTKATESEYTMTQITASTVNFATPVFIRQLRFRVFELQIRHGVFGSQRLVEPRIHILTTYKTQEFHKNQQSCKTLYLDVIPQPK